MRDVKRITKFLTKKNSRPSLSVTYVNGIDIPPKPKHNLGVAKVVYMDFPPVPKFDMNSEIEGLLKEKEQLKYDLSVLKFILKSYKQDEMDSNDCEPDVKENFGDGRQEHYQCNFCYFECVGGF